jgi:hypothetical protein
VYRTAARRPAEAVFGEFDFVLSDIICHHPGRPESMAIVDVGS